MVEKREKFRFLAYLRNVPGVPATQTRKRESQKYLKP